MAADIEEIRRRKREQLRKEAGNESTAARRPSEPVPIEGDRELSETVAEHDLVLADFYADWRGPCQMLEPIVETIAAATVAKVDVDANRQLAAESGVGGCRRSSRSPTASRPNGSSECRTRRSSAP